MSLLCIPMFCSTQIRLHEVATRDANTDWIYFKPVTRIAPEEFFVTFQLELGITTKDNFRLKRTWTDEMGFTHYLFHQYHEGVQVQNAVMLLHERDGELTTAHGQMVRGLRLSPHPYINPEVAIRKSLEALDAHRFA